MRLIIEPNYEKLSKWAANYVIERINAAKNQDKPLPREEATPPVTKIYLVSAIG